uniref:Si:ch73-305o9.3 n=1 Tax=Cyprinus carpio TaxID=7962 RepID=A0A8C1GB30_CYPCA
MGKPLSRPGCLRQSPCCSKKGDDREGYNEDGYIPQRSIYDTMCINEQIDHSSAHSTLGSRRGRETDFSSNGSLGAGGDMFDTRSSVLGSSGRKLDERFIFDSLKLANDELSKSPRGFVRSASPSVSCNSAPSGSMNKRHHHQDSSKKDNLCRHSWKVLAPPKFPETFELSLGEKTYLNPGVAFFPNSFTTPQISPFSGSPFSTGTHTPSVFFSPSPLPYHQQFNRQSLPIQPSSPRPPLSELSVSALMSGQGDQDKLEIGQGMRDNGGMSKDNLFLTFKPPNIEPEKEPPPTTPEAETDTTPLLRSQTSKRPAISPTPMESTWPRRLIGRRRTVRQGGAVHNLPILPPLPSLLIRSVSDKKTIPRLSPFPEHQGNVDGQLSKSMLTRDLKDCSLQEWKLLREQEERKPEACKIESVIEEDLEEESKIVFIQESVEPCTDENTTPECEEENWEAVLEMVNLLWDETWNEDLQSVGSLRRWPLLHPPSGFGGSQAPSGTSSELGAEDMLEIERMDREVVGSQDDDEPQFQYNLHTCKGQNNIIVTQPGSLKLAHDKVPTCLDLTIIDAQMGNKYGHSESPDSNLTLDSDSSGVYMSNPSQTSREDITMSDLGSITSLSQGEEGKVDIRKTGTYSSIPKANKLTTFNQKDPPGLRANSIELGRQAFCKEITTRATEIQARLKPVDTGSQTLEILNTVNTSQTDVPLPLSPSKHEAKETLLVKSDADPFIATDSFVYLAVAVLPQTTQESMTKPPLEEPLPPTSFAKPCPYPDECDFLSTDSFVYLAAPDCHLLVAEGHSLYDSKDSESEDSGSKADFVLASAVGGDSDWDSDLTDSEPEPNSSKPAWDYWEELEQGVLQELFSEDQSDADKLLHGNQAQQISCQPGELAAIVVQERAELEEVSSQYTQGAETHTEVKSVS